MRTGTKYILFTPRSSNKWMIISLLEISIGFFFPQYLPATQYLYYIYPVFVFVLLPGDMACFAKKKKKNELLED